jgi:hypothetical protein
MPVVQQTCDPKKYLLEMNSDKFFIFHSSIPYPRLFAFQHFDTNFNLGKEDE